MDKKVNKFLTKSFPNTIITKSTIKSSDNLFWYQLTDKTSKLNMGYLGVTQANSRSDVFEYMIVFNTNKTIKSVNVLTYREEYGGEIGSKRWLKQFIGKSNKTPLRLNKEINGISGATISCQSITKSIAGMTAKITHIE